MMDSKILILKMRSFPKERRYVYFKNFAEEFYATEIVEISKYLTNKELTKFRFLKVLNNNISEILLFIYSSLLFSLLKKLNNFYFVLYIPLNKIEGGVLCQE